MRARPETFLTTTLLCLSIFVGADAAAQSTGPDLATTRHEITLGGRTLAYTAHAGLLPIRLDETGEIRGRVFFTYYALDAEPGSASRPLTFLWNGGPGASSLLLHLYGFGPKHVRTADSPLDPPECDCVLDDNDATWLGATDLVFVDPIGTGFSRPSRPEYEEEFNGAREDAAYVAELVRVFLTRFDAWDAPLFLAGESYGTWRAAGAAKRLEEIGISVDGVILISGGIPVGPVEDEAMRVAHFITARTAAALHHGRLDPELQNDPDEAMRRSEAWATSEYAPALARRETLSDEERKRVVASLARYTGLPIEQIDLSALVVHRQEFAEKLLADQGVELTRFDTRLTTGMPTPRPEASAVLVGRYLRKTLGFETDAAYLGLEQGYRSVNDSEPAGPGARWRYNQDVSGAPPPVRLTRGDGPPGSRPSWLREALRLDPSMRVFVAAGLYDSLNSCSLNRHLVSRLEEELRDNFTLECYAGGHMMYADRDVRLRMKDDVTRFLAGSNRPRREASTPRSPPSLTDRDVVSSRHAIRFEDREIEYTARAGTLPIRDGASDELRAKIFFVSYSVEPAEGESARPLTFAWNGGPGANAGLLHVMAMGPRRLRMGDVYPTADPADMSTLVDNEATWLGATDLVFVDPVGTGYSRVTRAELGPEFYDTRGDVESLAELIRVYLTRFDAWDAPLFLVGESYGSLRAASVARSLQSKGIDVAGVVLLSGNPGLGTVPEHLEAPLLLPSLTATALYHGKLAPEMLASPEKTLDEARRWALEEYAPALERVERLTVDERASVARALSRFTGLSSEVIEASHLAVTTETFSIGLLEAEHRVLGRYDARLHRARKASEELFDPREDASLAPLSNTVSGNAPTMIRYLRYELGYASDLFYAGPFGGVWPPPERFRGDWMSVRWNRSEGPAEPLRDVMVASPTLRVLYAAGLYDLVTPTGPPSYLIDRLEPELKRRVQVRVYESGHSFYLDREARARFMRDATALIESAPTARRPMTARDP